MSSSCVGVSKASIYCKSKIMEEDTSQGKLWLMFSNFSSQNVILLQAFWQRGKVSFLYWAYALSVEQYPIISIVWLNSSYGSRAQELLRIALCTLTMTHFVPKASQLYTGMVTRSWIISNILRYLKDHTKNTLKCFPSIVYIYIYIYLIVKIFAYNFTLSAFLAWNL